MNTYELLFGPMTQEKVNLLAIAGFTSLNELGRIRDVWIEDHQREVGLVLVVYTRNGGGNRAEYQPIIDAWHNVPGFLSEADDEFDSTYCTGRWRLADPIQMALRAIAIENNLTFPGPVNTDQRWYDALARFEASKGGEK